jgi:DNA-directed RNA polymerase subunit M/transcription elongation factor TFIIS
MSSSPSARQYPVACPKCQQVKGYPYQVRTLTNQQGSIEVKLRCRDCTHEWDEVINNTE